MPATSTRSIQEPKKHHYLPEFFTTAWCGPDGQLIRYVNRNGEIHTRPFTPGQIGYRRDLYRFQSTSIENKTVIERHHFEKLDNAVAPVIERLNHDNRPILSEYDRIAIAGSSSHYRQEILGGSPEDRKSPARYMAWR